MTVAASLPTLPDPALLGEAQNILKTVFGYDAFRAPQDGIVTHLAAGGNALVLMPTGGGKSLCYQIPSLLRRGVGVVVSPLIALMKDQVDALRENGVRAEYLNSSLSGPQAREVERSLERGDLDLVYVAPERLLQPYMLDLLERSPVALFAIDEAHCVSQWGHDFRPEYQGLGVLAERFPQVPRAALTATADDRTRADIVRVLALEDARQFLSSFDRPNIQYRVGHKASPKTQLLDFIRAEHAAGTPEADAGIVYCLSRKSVEETAQWLTAQGIQALPYHAGLTVREREYAQERFIREEGVIVVATVAFGMGIDKPNVRFVAHLDLPKSMEGYYQETGRAGRDGLPATAWMVYGLSDVVNMRRMLAQSAAPEHIRRMESQKLDALLAYCETPRCRRQTLLSYFGETYPQPCGNCDTCRTPPETWDATRAAQMVLSAVVRTGNRFGAGHLIDVLHGNETERVLGLGHHALPTFGVGKDLSDKQWKGVLRQLAALGYLTTDAEGHGSLIATQQARAVLKGEETLRLRTEAEPPSREERRQKRSGKPGAASGYDPLFEALRALRLRLAKEQGVPPYVIFHDATLREMTEAQPQTLAQLGAVSGVGGRKLEAYGAAFLEVLTGEHAACVSPVQKGQAGNAAVLGILKGRPEAAVPSPSRAAPPTGTLSERLRAWRLALAREIDKPAFTILSNAVLDAIVSHRPQNEDELLTVPGMGQKKMENYGAEILRMVQEAGNA
ncbi:DNA helicase RecQ [Deinococcus ruber]|uniref:DNA helicase RecQ n=1 Tax=Deinococcus ruber TaxID=1848197 RepID=UPI001E46AD72|nr:DNA helicase RecQ [Deinococcus ruber]